MTDELQTSAPAIRDADLVRDASFASSAGIRHAFFTRRGGVSTGIYAGLNMGIGSKDDPDAVRQNRTRALAVLGVDGPEVVTPWQIHSAKAVVVTEPFAGDRAQADGIVTRTPGLAIGVVTADCGPILFADITAGVVGAAHAGWKGAAGGVLEATIEAMESCGATRGGIVAVLGPTITQGNYEVGADMLEAVLAKDATAAPFFVVGKAADKRQFDLPGYIVARLDAAGVTASFVGRCTYGEEDHFFSFRRTTHRGEPDYGRQLAAIAIAR
ncbi:MAG: peptidoglycan editing factor PgeF [Rhizobiaceae bacterium]|nr:peptidoglycan editing factor PgeF [Rhizobiaceae bacterium]